MNNRKRIGRLVWNYYILAYDIIFPDGSNWGGLAEGQPLEALSQYGVWVSTRLMSNGFGWYLQGINGYDGMFVRI
jgi:hypothetical protein